MQFEAVLVSDLARVDEHGSRGMKPNVPHPLAPPRQAQVLPLPRLHPLQDQTLGELHPRRREEGRVEPYPGELLLGTGQEGDAREGRLLGHDEPFVVGGEGEGGVLGGEEEAL